MDEDAPAIPAIAPHHFQRAHAEAVGEEQLRGLVQILDLQERLPAVRRLRDWAMAALSPSPGETCVDVGAGTGAEVLRLAAAVGPEGTVTGIEPHPGMRAEAQRRAHEAGAHVQFIDGDAAALPFSEGEVDVLRCERVFQHLPDPQSAAREIARVLRPGGRAVVLDSDWGTAIISPGAPEVLQRYTDAFWARLPNPSPAGTCAASCSPPASRSTRTSARPRWSSPMRPSRAEESSRSTRTSPSTRAPSRAARPTS